MRANLFITIAIVWGMFWAGFYTADGLVALNVWIYNMDKKKKKKKLPLVAEQLFLLTMFGYKSEIREGKHLQWASTKNLSHTIYYVQKKHIQCKGFFLGK